MKSGTKANTIRMFNELKNQEISVVSFEGEKRVMTYGTNKLDNVFIEMVRQIKRGRTVFVCINLPKSMDYKSNNINDYEKYKLELGYTGEIKINDN